MINIGASEAKIKANARYNKKTYKQLKANVKFADYDMIEDYCNNNNISKAKLIINSIKYCINNNINVFDDQNTNNSKDNNSQSIDLDNEQE